MAIIVNIEQAIHLCVFARGRYCHTIHHSNCTVQVDVVPTMLQVVLRSKPLLYPCAHCALVSEALKMYH